MIHSANKKDIPLSVTVDACDMNENADFTSSATGSGVPAGSTTCEELGDLLKKLNIDILVHWQRTTTNIKAKVLQKMSHKDHTIINANSQTSGNLGMLHLPCTIFSQLFTCNCFDTAKMDVSKPFLRELLIFGVGGLTMVASLSLLHRFRRPLGQGALRLSSTRAGESPNPEWKAGVNQPIPYENKAYSSYLTSDLRKSGGLYGLGISAIVPRPIALVSSQDANGVLNCAPYSYFNIVSHDPPLVVIGNCINMRAQSKKDTLQNIEATGQFVVNIMSSWYVESANHCSGAFPPDVSEFEVSGLSTLPSDIVKPPRVGEAAVQLECEVSCSLAVMILMA